MSEYKLIINNISKSFYDKNTGKRHLVLTEISLRVKEGEFICVVGPSGCGKTTLLRVIAGLEVADKGKIIVDGTVTDTPSSEKGMIFQEFALFPWRTVEKNIEFGLEYKGFSKDNIKKISKKYLDMVNLSEWKDAYPFELSGGMKQRVALARALANDPKILLMDEPFGSLDAQTRNIMQLELLKIWRRTNKTVIFVSHNVDEAVFLGGRIIVLSSRPSKIKSVHTVKIDHPRDRTNSQFQSIRREILKEISEDVLKSYI